MKAIQQKAGGSMSEAGNTDGITRQGMDGDTISDEHLEELLDILRQRGETVTTVESLTAGLIAARIADIPGASDVLKRAYVTYCDQAKHEMVGVRDETLKAYTAVSAQTAEEMAEGGARAAAADLCLSATGYAGPPSSPEDRSVGLVFLGCSYRGKVRVLERHYKGTRNEVRAQARDDALRMMDDALGQNVSD